jgi:nitrogenase molybdenum-iron protein beta chain
LDRIGHLYAGFNLQRDIGIIADSTYAIGLIKFLANDFGMNPSFVAVTDEPPIEINDTIRKEILDLDYHLKPRIIIESDGNKIWTALEETRPNFLFAGSFDTKVAEDLDIPRLSVSYPITDRVILSRGYAGYRGSITLIEDMVTILMKDMHLVINSTLVKHGYKKSTEQFAQVA